MILVIKWILSWQDRTSVLCNLILSSPHLDAYVIILSWMKQFETVTKPLGFWVLYQHECKYVTF